jgi:hypothetical protein
MKQSDANNIIRIIAVLGLITLIVIAGLYYVPVSDKKNVIVTTVVKKPLLSDAEIISVKTEVKPNTILSQASILSIFQDITKSGELEVKAQMGDISSSEILGRIYRNSETTSTIILYGVSADVNTGQVTLYEDNVVVSEKVITL